MRVFPEMTNYYHRCGVCFHGWWQQMALHNNNLECPCCGSSSHEKIRVADVAREVPKIHRVQIEVGDDGLIWLPSYNFHCTKCNVGFPRPKMDWDKQGEVRCPECSSSTKSGKVVFDGEWKDAVKIAPLVSEEESNEFFEGHQVATPSQLRQYKQKTSDPYFVNGRGEARSLLQPVRNHETGKVEMVLRKELTPEAAL